jgi:hypothetical protein
MTSLEYDSMPKRIWKADKAYEALLKRLKYVWQGWKTILSMITMTTPMIQFWARRLWVVLLTMNINRIIQMQP